jgi:predicted acyl esterase
LAQPSKVRILPPPSFGRRDESGGEAVGERGGEAQMLDERQEVKFLAGIPPGEAGCPAPNPRLEHVDGMLVAYDATVPMRDGLEIFVDVFRPADAADPVPVIIAWGPYGKHGAVSYDLFGNHGVDPAWISRHAGFEAPDPFYWTRHGYAVIAADPRGTWNSPGDATFYSAQEARDVYDLIEWAGTREWSNGKVGMSGVSYLAITQWRVAAEHPPHLAAINPWEGLTDRYRDMAYHGGIPETRFGPMWRSRRVPYSNGLVEDTVAMYAAHPLLDSYWESKTPRLADIEVPAFVVASWSDQGLHTRGTLEGYKQISSREKWLLVHGRKKWSFYYQPENVELLRQFFDRFLRGVAGTMDGWPPVRLEVRERVSVGSFRDETEWPIARVAPRRLYLDASSAQLAENPPAGAAAIEYAAASGERAQFTHRFASATELVGSMRLRLWVSTGGGADIDLFVALQKLDRHGELVPFCFLNSLEDGPVALGWLRASHRELDAERSSELQPWHHHRREQPLSDGECVLVEVEVWPSATRFEADEQLRLIVAGADIYNYEPPIVSLAHERTRNRGTHTIHTGPAHDSYLLVPTLQPRVREGVAGGADASPRV